MTVVGRPVRSPRAGDPSIREGPRLPQGDLIGVFDDEGPASAGPSSYIGGVERYEARYPHNPPKAFQLPFW